MRAFTVLVNGKELCTAGIGTNGVLSSIVNWSGREGNGGFHMSVSGLDSTTDKHLRWPVQEIGVGDEILTRLIETDDVDQSIEDGGKKVVAAARPNPLWASVASLFVLDPQNHSFRNHGIREFFGHPRIGEWVETQVDGADVMVRVVMVNHAAKHIEIFAVIEGKAKDCLDRLIKSESGH